MKKSIIGLVAAAVAFASSITPFSAVSAAELPDGGVCSQQESEEITLRTSSASSGDLLYNYMLQQSGVTPKPDDTKNGAAVNYRSGISAGERLTGNDAIVYNYLKTEIQKIAAGQRTSTVINIPKEKLGIENASWSASDLGVTAVVSNNQITDESTKALRKEICDFSAVINALLADCPYDLYWCDKTLYSSSIGSVGARTENGEWKLYLRECPYVTFYVSTDYSLNGASQTTSFPDGRLAAVSTAIANAQQIVDDNSDKTGRELLAAFRDAICDLTSYNYDALGDDVPYGDPWQIINTFDGDESTKVVCEGYAKSFKYLCDIAADKLPNISCLLATGPVDFGSTAGPHMWNVVNMDDNRSYLVDITSCDSSIENMEKYLDEGASVPEECMSAAFLSTPSSGTYSTTYQFIQPSFRFTYNGRYWTMPSETSYYTYDEDTLATFKTDYLQLSTIPYVAYNYVPAKAATCTEDGNIAYYTDSDGNYYILDGTNYIETTASAVKVPKTGHDWNSPTYTWSSDNSKVTAKRVCKNDASHVDTETANASSRVAKAATCTSKGKTTYTAQFSNSAFVKQEKTLENISALGHSYGTPQYTWSADGSSCTATVSCTRSGCSEKIEEQAVITSSVKTPATYTAKGWTRYTASFSDSHFSSQTKDVPDISMLVGTEVVIDFVDINGIKTSSTVYVETYSGYELPSIYLDGYNFIGWTINGTLYTSKTAAEDALDRAVASVPAEPVKVCVKYEKKAGSYTVSVTGGKLSNGKTSDSVNISSLVTVKANTVGGKQFSHWMRNGVKVSTNETYSFYMPSENISLTAVFVDGSAQKVGTAIIESVKADSGKLSFVSVLNVPTGCKFVKGGLVATSNSSIGENVTASNAMFVKLSTKATASTRNMKYTWTKSNVSTSLYVRGYLVYKDSSGVEHTVYSDCVKSDPNGEITKYQNGICT